MKNTKAQIYLFPWLISLVFAACTIATLAIFFPPEKLCVPCVPIAVGSFLAAAGYNVYELIVSNRK